MKIYCAHSSAFDYQHDWYDIYRNSAIAKKNTCIFPHEDEAAKSYSYPVIQSCDCVIAEVSHHSTWMGIELGWAQTFGKPIFCFYKNGSKPSSSLQAVTKNCIAYSSPEELLELISKSLSHEMNHA